MNPDTKTNFTADASPTNPFDNAMYDHKAGPATRIIMTCMMEEYRLGRGTHVWIGLEEQIEGLGYDRGRAVLEEISSFVETQKSLSLLEAKTILRVYCAQQNIDVPEIPVELRSIIELHL